MIIQKTIDKVSCEFHITKRKKQKRIIIRRKSPNTFLVSAPHYATKHSVEKALEQHLDNLLKLPSAIDIKTRLNQATLIPIFDDLYAIKFIKEGINHIDDALKIIYIKAHQNRYQAIRNLLKPLLLKEIESLKNLYQDDFPLKDVTFRLQYMKSKYGSCQPIKKHISMNLELIHYPKEYLQFIFVHEATHLLYPNHSKAFYDHLTTYIPNHLKMKKTLEIKRKAFYKTND